MLDDDERPEADAAGPAATPAAATAAGGLFAEHSRDGCASGDPPLAADPARYSIADEPVPDGAPVDYRYLFDLVAAQLDREEARGRALDTKIATLLAGVVAGIGFSFRAAPSLVSSGAALLYLIPFALIASAYTTRLVQDAPKPSAIVANFATYPVTTLASAIVAMNKAYEVNRRNHSIKANRFDLAFLATLAVTGLVLLSQLYVAWRSPLEPVATAPVAAAHHAAATTAHARRLPGAGS